MHLNIIQKSKMQSNLTQISIQQILQKIAESNKKVTIQQCQYTWQAFNKIIVTLSEPQKSLSIFDMFIVSELKDKTTKYIWKMTKSMSEALGLQIENQNKYGVVMNFSKKKFIQMLPPKTMQPMNLTGELVWAILEAVFQKIKSYLDFKYEIYLQFFGSIWVQNGCFYHNLKQKSQFIIKKLKTPKRRSSLLNPYLKINSQSSQFIKRESSDASICSEKKNISKISQLKQVSNIISEKQPLQQKRWIHQLAVPDARIPDDLLGAGIDPLKFDYNYSKLVSDSSQLFNKTFLKAKPAKIRHPGIIDKFERTNGVPQTGLKVSSSIILRIGSNYNLYSKHLYTDIKARCIMKVPKQPKITLNKYTDLKASSATEEQEYRYLIGEANDLKEKVELRRKTYKRYKKYLSNFIDNSNVCPMSPETIKRILSQLHVGNKNQQRSNQYFCIAQKTINEANHIYYQANKKAILDYILKDEKQRQRTGIDCIFGGVVEWGNSKNPPKQKIMDKQFKNKIFKKLEGYLYFPKCIVEITDINLKIKEIDLFMIKNHIAKAVNVLYFIKKQKTQTSEIVTYLSTEWIKNVVQVVKRHICVPNLSQDKINTLIQLINVILSNTLKSIIQTSFKKLTDFFGQFSGNQSQQKSPILQVSITDEGGKFVLTDDFRKILMEQFNDIIRSIFEETSKIHSIQFYLQDDPNSYLNALNEEDPTCKAYLNEILQIIEENCLLIQQFLYNLSSSDRILKYKQDAIEWIKEDRDISEYKKKLQEIKELQNDIDNIPHCYKQKMFLIQCFQEKQKLRTYLTNLKTQIYQHLENTIKNNNYKSYMQIEQIRQGISANVQTTRDYLSIGIDIERIKNQCLPSLSKKIGRQKHILMNLLSMDYGYISASLIEKVYRATIAFRSLPSKIQYHEERLEKQKSKLEKTLNQSIKQFESKTANQLKTINSRLQEFEIRRIYSDYLIEIQTFKQLVNENQQEIKKLNTQQDDLKWKRVQFKSADQLKNLVIPSLELWQLILEFDNLMKEWKNIPISKMDAESTKQKIEKINERNNHLKLKNLSSMKISSELQTDCKEILNQQLNIIQIFSHHGVKDRHWQVFNSKLMIPGYNLKEITYNKIKIFYEYSSVINTLSAISKQAAREYEVEKQRNSQQQYWSEINFITYTRKSDNSFCIDEKFLDQQSEVLKENQTRLSVMKNYLYSKTLYQQLNDWQSWLSTAITLFQNLQSIQTYYHKIKGIMVYDSIAKQMPVEYSEFETIESAWKTISKKIFEHPKIVQFSKSAKILQFTEETLKKIENIARGIPEFLKTKRLQYPRFFFTSNDTLISILGQSVFSLTQKQGLQLAFSQCFTPGTELVHDDDKIHQIKSGIDYLLITSEPQKVKTRKRICENMNLITNAMKISLYQQISTINYLNLPNSSSILIQKYCLSAIFCYHNLKITKVLEESQTSSDIVSHLTAYNQQIKQLVASVKENSSLMVKTSKILISLLSLTEILRKYQYLQTNIHESYMFKTQLKFRIAQTVTSPVQSKDNISIARKSINKVQKVYDQIRKSRKQSMSQNMSCENQSEQISIEVFNRKTNYGFEYWGQSASNFRALYSDRVIVNIFANWFTNTVNYVNQSGNLHILGIIANICGRPLKVIKTANHHENLDDLIRGGIVSGVWAWIDTLQLSSEYFQKINSTMQELNAKGNSEQSNNSNQNKSIFINRLNEILTVDNRSMIFMNLPDTQFTSIPASYRTRMRSISICVPQFSKMTDITTQFVEQVSSIDDENIKAKMTGELTSFHRKPSVTKNDELEVLITHRQITEDNKASLVDKLIKNIYIDRDIEQIRALYQQLELLRESPKNQDNEEQPRFLSHKMSDTLFNKQRETFQEFHRRISQQFTTKLQNYNRVVVSGPSRIKSDIISQKLKKQPNYKNIDAGLYGFPIGMILDDPEKYIRAIVNNIYFDIKDNNRKINVNDRIYIWLQYETTICKDAYTRIDSIAHQIQKQGIFLPQNHQKREVSLTIVYDCLDLSHISPYTLTETAIVNVQPPANLNIGEYMSKNLIKYLQMLQPLQNYDSNTNLQSISFQVENFERVYQQILSSVLKARSAKIFQSVVNTKVILTENFVRMVKLYFSYIKNKTSESTYYELDISSYVRNTFLYCLYWTFCVGFLESYDYFQIQEMILKEYFPEVIDIECISKYFLTEENEWLVWAPIKDELTTIKNTSNLMISTQQNMGVYLNILKYLQLNQPITIILQGTPCSRKSTILKGLNSNFSFFKDPRDEKKGTKDSFILNCHPVTSSDFVNELFKNQMYFKRNEEKIVLIDDVNLPFQQKQIGQIIKKLAQQRSLVFKDKERSRIVSKKAKFQSFIITYSNRNQGSESYKLLRQNSQQINLQVVFQNQVTNIFKSYLQIELSKINSVEEDIQKYSEIAINYINKINRKFSLSLHDTRKIIKLVMSNFRDFQHLDSQPGSTKILNKTTLLNTINLATSTVIDTFKESIIHKYLLDESNKLANGLYARDITAVKDKMLEHLFSNLPAQLKAEVEDNKQGVSGMEECIEKILYEKQGFQYISASFLTQIIFKMINIIKSIPSHMILITEGSFGVRTMVRLASSLSGIAFNEIQYENIDSIISDCVNIIKVGGRIDQSTYYIGPLTLEKIKDEEILSMINSFITQPELPSFFTQKRIQQIFMKFGSEKKTIKRNQFIKKIKQKIDELFHFFINMDFQHYSQINKKYPEMVKLAYKQKIIGYPTQALVIFGQKVISKWKTQSILKLPTLIDKNIVKCMLEIQNKYYEIEAKRKQINNNQTSQHKNNIVSYRSVKSIEYFKTFPVLFKRMESINQPEEGDDSVWEQRTKETQQKYESLLSQKEKLVKQNNKYFEKNYKFNQELEQQEMKIKYLTTNIKAEQEDRRQLTENFLQLKNQQKANLMRNDSYEQLLDIEAYMLSFNDYDSFTAIYNHHIFQTICSVVDNSLVQSMEVDIKSKVMEIIEKARLQFCEKLQQAVGQWETSRDQNNENTLEGAFLEWIQTRKKLSGEMRAYQNQLVESQQKIERLDVKIQKIKQQLEKIEEESDQLRQNFANQFPESASTTKSYEEVCKALAQTESVLNIFKHFQSVVKRRKTQNNRFCIKNPKQYIGNIIFTCAFINFSACLSDQQLLDFCNSCKSVIKDNNFELEDSQILQCFLNKQEKFKHKYVVAQRHDTHLIAHIAISINLCTLLHIEDPEKLFSFYNFLKQMTGDNIKLIEDNDHHLINTHLSTGQKIIVINANVGLIKKLKPLIDNEGEVRNNKIYINLDEQIILNSESRVIFVFTGHYGRQMISQYFSDIWQVKFISYPEKSEPEYLKKNVKNQLCKYRTKQCNLIQRYIDKCQELLSIEKKIDNLIVSIRKSFENPDSVIAKIELVSEEKDKILIRMEQIIESINEDQLKISDDPIEQEINENLETFSNFLLQLNSNQNTLKPIMFLKFIKSGKSPNSQTDLFRISKTYQNHFYESPQPGTLSEYAHRYFSNQPSTSDRHQLSTLDNHLLSTSDNSVNLRRETWEYLLSSFYDTQNIQPQIGTQEPIHQILILQSIQVFRMQQYIHQCLIAINKEVETCQIDSMNQLTMTQSSKDKIILVIIKYKSEWNILAGSLKRNTLKNNLSKICVICSSHLQIPYQIQLQSGIMPNFNETQDLASIILNESIGSIKGQGPLAWLYQQLKMMKQLKNKNKIGVEDAIANMQQLL